MVGAREYVEVHAEAVTHFSVQRCPVDMQVAVRWMSCGGDGEMLGGGGEGRIDICKHPALEVSRGHCQLKSRNSNMLVAQISMTTSSRFRFFACSLHVNLASDYHLFALSHIRKEVLLQIMFLSLTCQ